MGVSARAIKDAIDLMTDIVDSSHQKALRLAVNKGMESVQVAMISDDFLGVTGPFRFRMTPAMVRKCEELVKQHECLHFTPRYTDQWHTDWYPAFYCLI